MGRNGRQWIWLAIVACLCAVPTSANNCGSINCDWGQCCANAGTCYSLVETCQPGYGSGSCSGSGTWPTCKSDYTSVTLGGESGTAYFQIPNSGCSKCAAGTYSDESTISASMSSKTCIRGAGSTFSYFPSWSGCYGSMDTTTLASNCALGGNCKYMLCPAANFGDSWENVWLGQCQKCPAGKYSAEGATSCTPCPPGTYQSDEGQSGCTSCPAGQFNPSYGQTSQDACQLCPLGSYAAAGSAECTPCPSWTSTPFEGSTSASNCTACPMGQATVTASSGDTVCQPCPAGQWPQFNAGGPCQPLNFGEAQCPGGYACSASAFSGYGAIPATIGGTPTYMMRSSSNSLVDVCLNPATLMSLNDSMAVAALYGLIYEGPYGINTVVEHALEAINAAANYDLTKAQLEDAISELENAPLTWWNYVSGGVNNSGSSDPEQFYQESLPYCNGTQAVFDDGTVLDFSTEYEAYWYCSGALFGCTALVVSPTSQYKSPTCPFAEVCFQTAQQVLLPYMTSPGGYSSFASNPDNALSRQTSKYTYEELANLAGVNLNALLQWQNSLKIYELYASLYNQVKQTTGEIETVVLQGDSNLASITGTSSQANLQEAESDMASSYAEITSSLIAYNEIGLQINASQYGNQLQFLLNECQQEIEREAILDLIEATVSLGLTIASDGENAASASGTFKKAIAAITLINDLAKGVAGLLSDASNLGQTLSAPQFPSVPQLNSPQVSVSTQAQQSVEFFGTAAKNMTEAFQNFTSATWQSIYLENYNSLYPLYSSPPDCKDYSGQIQSLVQNYLIQVKNMTNQGEAASNGAMQFVKASQMAETAQATLNAVNSTLSSIESSLQLVPQPQAYQSATYAILGSKIAFMNLAAQFFVAQFLRYACVAYSYINSNQQFSSCIDFGNNLPDYGVYSSIISASADATGSSMEPPSAVASYNGTLVSKLMTISQAMATAQFGYGTPVATETQTFSLNLNATNAGLYGGNLTDGKINFLLTPDSPLLAQSTEYQYAFGVEGSNPVLLNVQAFLKGAQSEMILEVETYVSGPYQVYSSGSSSEMIYQTPSFSQPYGQTTQSYAGLCGGIDYGSCPTGSTTSTINFGNGTMCTYCGNIDSPVLPELDDFQPAVMWGYYEVSVNEGLWRDVVINEAELELQMYFQYSIGSGDSSALLTQCYEDCNSMTCGQGESVADAFCVGNCEAGTCPATDIAPPIEGNCVCNIFSCSCHGCGCTGSTSRKLVEQSQMAYADLCSSFRQQGLEYFSRENITAIKQLYDTLICPPDKEVSTAELEEILKTLDQDNDGKISCFEYLTAKNTTLVKDCQGNSAIPSLQSTKIWSAVFAFVSILCSLV